MKRSPQLAPLSRDHHVALEHALRLRRASEEDIGAVVARFLAFLLGPGRSHFALEEALLAPEVPEPHADLARRMVDEHAEILRRAGALGQDPCVVEARALGELLTRHVRFEEREVFPLLEAHLSGDRIREIGRSLDRA
jgi:Hemerythrin HHE cation binding domain